MSFPKSVAVLAIVCAVIVLPGSTAFAAESDEVVVARDPIATVKSDEPNESASNLTEVSIVAGDTLSQLAKQYNVTVQALIEANSIDDPDLIAVGQVITVPDAVDNADQPDTGDDEFDALRLAADQFLAPPPAPVVRPSTPKASTKIATVSSSAGNTYVWGQCTWYIKQRKPYIPNRLGNAGYNWVRGMAAAGYGSGSVPSVGAIGVQPGHVVIVESINADGSVNISEMNYAGGVGVVHTRTVPASTFTYIYA